jgi:ATP-dependent DNA ligase
MDIAELLINYKHNVASKYLPVRGDQIGTRVFEMEKYYLSTKIDGHLCFIYKEGNNISILNHNNKPFDRTELNKELESILKDQEGLFVGEIHLHHENKRTRSYDLTKEISNDKSDIRIAIFDILRLKDKEFQSNDWNNKKNILSEIFPKSGIIFYLDEVELSSRKDIEVEFQKRAIDLNLEGVVVRGESGPVFKIKQYLSFDLVVLGYVNGHANDFSLLKEILIGVMIDKNKFLSVGIVVNGFTVSDRETLSLDFEKIKVESDSIQVSNSKLPFTMIEPKYIVEIESTDIITSNSDGFIKRPLLIFNNNFLLDKYSNSISLTTPVFKKFRQDKKVNEKDVGLNQITRVVDIIDKVEEESNKSSSELIKRDVYVKITKGFKMVKKFLVWDTKAVLNDYPKYVFYKIDYSPTRKDKMKRDIKVSNDEEQIMKIFDTEIETDIKSGWEKI